MVTRIAVTNSPMAVTVAVHHSAALSSPVLDGTVLSS